MKMYKDFLPEKQEAGKRGYYPVTNEQEWNDLPAVYKAMEWFPTEVLNTEYGFNTKEMTSAEYIIFDVTYMEPYGVSASVKVHVENVQKILFCLYENAQCHLYRVSGVVFENGVERRAEWRQDVRTGAYAIYSGGKCIGKQGGFMGFIPNRIDKGLDGKFRYAQRQHGTNKCFYEYGNPYR